MFLEEVGREIEPGKLRLPSLRSALMDSLYHTLAGDAG